MKATIKLSEEAETTLAQIQFLSVKSGNGRISKENTIQLCIAITEQIIKAKPELFKQLTNINPL